MKFRAWIPLVVAALIAVSVAVGMKYPTWKYNNLMEHQPRVYGKVEQITDDTIYIRVKFVSGGPEYPDGKNSLMTVRYEELVYPENGKRFEEFSVGDNIFVVFDGALYGTERLTAETVYVFYSYS